MLVTQTNPPTVWEGTAQGCDLQEEGHIGGHPGDVYIVTFNGINFHSIFYLPNTFTYYFNV